MIISSDLNIESLMKLIDFQNNFSGGLITPEINIEIDGVTSLSWYGENGSLIIAFPNDKDFPEYSYLGKNGDNDFGDLDDDKFDILVKKAGIESLIKVKVYDKRKKK